MSKPELSLDFTVKLRESVAIEVAAQRQIRIGKTAATRRESWRESYREFLKFRVMPYTVGSFASLVIFVTVFASFAHTKAVFQKLAEQSMTAQAEKPPRLVVDNRQYEEYATLPTVEYSLRRQPFAIESPSLNPSSAFVAFTANLAKNSKNQNPVVFVADVFSDGLATIADVVESPHDQATLDEMEKLLRDEPAFVPSSLDRRPQNVRVVFLIQNVEVRENQTKVQTSKTKSQTARQKL